MSVKGEDFTLSLLLQPHRVFAVLLLVLPTAASAQPAPSATVECGELRHLMTELAPEEELIVIEVAGALTAVEHDGTLGYMFMCEAPDPRVLCITYEIGDYAPGDRVILGGTLTPLDEDHIRLDPCLHYPPDAYNR
jgi:hypothetical protein